MRAMGGQPRVAAARTLTIEGTGTQYNLGQDLTPDQHDQTFALDPYRRVLDIANARQRVQQRRTPQFPYYQGQQPQEQIQVLDGTVAFNVNASGQATRVGGDAEAERRLDYWHHPLTIARALLQPSTKVTSVQTIGMTRQAAVATPDRTFVLTTDATGQPLSIASRVAHPNLGDVVVMTTFAKYVDVGGLKLPSELSGKVDDFTTWDVHAARQSLDEPAEGLAAPAEVAAAAAASPAPTVTAEVIGKGAWRLAGQSHHSALIEFRDHLMLIEAPQSEARTLAVIAHAKSLVPGKPLTQLVTTHHHFDHTAGMRAAIADGMTVITQAGNKAWVEAMAARPYSILPDTLAKHPARLQVETVDGEREIADQGQQVVLYHLEGNPHSDTLLVAYLPRDRVLIEVDAFSPGAPANPYAANLLEHIQKRKWRVDTIVSLHGPNATLSDLQQAVAAGRVQ
mgnify:CR=1 FL=1